MDLNYIHTPNIDQKNIKIDLVGNKNIYLSSSKVDENVEDGSLVKCSLKNNTCSYMKQ